MVFLFVVCYKYGSPIGRVKFENTALEVSVIISQDSNLKMFFSFYFLIKTYSEVLKFEPVFKNPKLPLCGMCSNIKTALSSQISGI